MPKRVVPFVPIALIVLLAACAPSVPEPTPLEPVTPQVVPEQVPEVMEPEVLTPEPTTPAPEASAPEEPAPEEPTVTVIPAEPEVSGEAASAPSGGSVVTDPSDPGISATIGISADNQSFISSTVDETNPITVAAGGTFYLQIQATDQDGVTAAVAELRNSDAAGPLPTGPFNVASSDCETQAAAAPTELTCTVAVTIAPGAQNIAQEGETAYAFRPLITDAAGNSDLAYSWGYLVIQ